MSIAYQNQPKPIHVVHIAHEGVLPEWRTGGAGVYIDSLSQMQAKDLDRRVSVIIPYYLQYGEVKLLGNDFLYASKITFNATLHDPKSGEEYQTTATCLTKVIKGVRVFALKPDRKQRDLFTLDRSGTFSSIPEQLRSQGVNLNSRLNYFDELSAEFVKSRLPQTLPAGSNNLLQEGFATESTVYHTHNYGGAAIKLSPSPICAALVNMIHSKPLDTPLPVYLQSTAPKGEALKQRALLHHTVVTASTPHAFKHLRGRKTYTAYIRDLEQRSCLIPVRPSIDLETKFTFSETLKLISPEERVEFQSADIVKKKGMCLRRLKTDFKNASKTWIIDPSKPTALFIGRLTNPKGIQHLESLILKAKNLGFNFAIMGLPSEHPECRDFESRMLRDHPDTPFLNSMALQNEYGPLLRASADIGLLLSAEEEFGLVLPEHQAFGALCISSKVGGTPYAVAQRAPSPLLQKESTADTEVKSLLLPPVLLDTNQQSTTRSGSPTLFEKEPERDSALSRSLELTSIENLESPSDSTKAKTVKNALSPKTDNNTTARPDPRCGTFYEIGASFEETDANLTETFKAALLKFHSYSREERVANQEYIVRKAHHDFHPSSWLERVEKVYQKALKFRKHREHAEERLTDTRVITVTGNVPALITAKPVKIKLPELDKPKIGNRISSGTINLAIQEALQTVSSAWGHYEALIASALAMPPPTQQSFIEADDYLPRSTASSPFLLEFRADTPILLGCK